MSLFIHALLLLQQGGDVPALPTTDPPTVRFQPWRDNYIQLGSWRSDLPEITPAAAGGRNKDVETEFQLSFRYLFLADWLQDVLGRETSVFAAYTTRSYWQVWNSADSRPFRTTEHAPELAVAQAPARAPGGEQGEARRARRPRRAHARGAPHPGASATRDPTPSFSVPPTPPGSPGSPGTTPAAPSRLTRRPSPVN